MSLRAIQFSQGFRTELVVGLTAVGILAGSFFIGREIGRHNSADYGRESSALTFLMTHMQVISSDEKDVRLAVATELHTYEYSLSGDSVIRSAKPAFEVASTPIKRRWALLEDKRLMEFAGIVVTVPAATGALAKISSATSRLASGSRLAVYAVGAVALATGGIAGYYTTFEDVADYDNKVFRKTLLDAASWRTTARFIKLCERAKHRAEIMVELQRDDPELAPSKKLAEMEIQCAKMTAWLKDHL